MSKTMYVKDRQEASRVRAVIQIIYVNVVMFFHFISSGSVGFRFFLSPFRLELGL